jgi:uncharacterized protein
MQTISSPDCAAFAGTQLIAFGPLSQVALKAQQSANAADSSPVLIFDDLTSRLIELDLRGTPEELSQRIAAAKPTVPDVAEASIEEDQPRGPGRPKLGVVAREVTLLPRHWEWLATQPGGASVALRKLVEEARRTNQGKDRQRLAQESAYRFLSAMAGNEPGFEEAARALFAGNKEGFAEIIEPWPMDVGNHANKLAARAFLA